MLEDRDGSEVPSVLARIRTKFEVVSSRIGEKCGGSKLLPRPSKDDFRPPLDSIILRIRC